jgi:hypothetical protein
LRVAIRQGGDDVTVACTLPVGMSPRPLSVLWPYLAWPPVVIGLFAMNQRLRRRTIMAARKVSRLGQNREAGATFE